MDNSLHSGILLPYCNYPAAADTDFHGLQRLPDALPLVKCEVLGGLNIHFAPYRDEKRVAQSAEAIPDKPSSLDGFISDKDSGCMLYIIRLR